MKVKLNHETFKPRVLEITLESQEEIDFLYATFNWISFSECMRREVGSGDAPGIIREALSGIKSPNHADILVKLKAIDRY